MNGAAGRYTMNVRSAPSTPTGPEREAPAPDDKTTQDAELPSARPSTAVAVSARSERLMESGHWLLAARAEGPKTYTQWSEAGGAWLRPGALFTVVVVRADVMHRALGRPGPLECAETLADVLDGPVFYRSREFGAEGGYTVLLRVSAARTWRVRGTVVVSVSAQVLVPAPDRLEPAPEALWWVVPPDGPGTLCAPAALVSLLARGDAISGAWEGDRA